jgi:hypothetical protein
MGASGEPCISKEDVSKTKDFFHVQGGCAHPPLQATPHPLVIVLANKMIAACRIVAERCMKCRDCPKQKLQCFTLHYCTVQYDTVQYSQKANCWDKQSSPAARDHAPHARSSWKHMMTVSLCHVTHASTMQAVIHTCQAFMHKPAHVTNAWMLYSVS